MNLKIFIMRYQMLVIICFFALAACTVAKVNVDVVSERTALENQVLGTYHALDSELLRLASVRAVDSSGKLRPPLIRSQDHKNAMLAMQRLAFHADDLDVFKQIGWIGENNTGLLSVFWQAPDRLPEAVRELALNYQRAEFDSIIKQVNQDRIRMMERVIDLNENFRKNDLAKIQKIFGKLNREQALPGVSVQLEDGQWVKQS